MAVYITGSLAYDRIMNFPGKFTDSIMKEHLHILNVSFFIDRLDERLGGVAGNIAYNMALLDEKPIIVSRAGRDFENYRSVLEKLNLPLEGIDIDADDLTAGCYLITDQTNNQIVAFHAAAIMKRSSYTFPHLDPKNDLAIIGAANPEEMIAHPKMYKEKNVRYIFDPSQQLPVLPAEGLREAVNGAYILVGNDYEIKLISEMTGFSFDELVNMTTRGVITTYGEKGSAVFEKGKEPVMIGIAPTVSVLDPTGAGDAYRAGLIKGLLKNLPLESCAKLGATCSSYCIEHKGTQAHRFTLEKFKKRYESAFGEGSFPI